VLEGTGRTYRIGKAYTIFMSIPAHIVRDTGFPFDRDGNEKFHIVVKGRKIIAEPLVKHRLRKKKAVSTEDD
jgi:hypothetical protein